MAGRSDVPASDTRKAPGRAQRPSSVRIDAGRCIACVACESFVPGMLDATGSVPVTSLALDAMAACPTGAIVWVEPRGDEPNVPGSEDAARGRA